MRYKRNQYYKKPPPRAEWTSGPAVIIILYTYAGKRIENSWSAGPSKSYKIIITMNKSQIKFTRAVTATWKVLRDPVLTSIYMNKWKHRKDVMQTIYGFVFNQMYRAA